MPKTFTDLTLVNNVGRAVGITELKAALDALATPAASTDGWTADSVVWTYATGSGGGTATFTAPGDLTAQFAKGTRIKLTQSGTVKYFVVIGAVFSTGTTTVTITGGSDYTLASAAISATYYSYASSPQGYPHWFNYAPTMVGWATNTPDLARFAVVGRQCFVDFTRESTSNATTVTFTTPILAASALTPFITCIAKDNGGSYASGRLYLNDVSTFKAGPNTGTDIWTGSGTKGLAVSTWYSI